MFFKMLCFLAPCLAMMSVAAAASSSKPMVVFYGNISQDGGKFFSSVYKTFNDSKINEMKEMNASMVLKLNPYFNNTVILDNGTCKLGSTDECDKYKFIACILANGTDIATALNFVNCSTNPTNNTLKQCAKIAGISNETITACDKKPVDPWTKFANEYWRLNIDSTPAVVCNDNYNKTMSDNGVLDFPSVFCSCLKASNISTEYCKSKESSATIPSVSVLTFVIASILLVKMYQ